MCDGVAGVAGVVAEGAIDREGFSFVVSIALLKEDDIDDDEDDDERDE